MESVKCKVGNGEGEVGEWEELELGVGVEESQMGLTTEYTEYTEKRK